MTNYEYFKDEIIDIIACREITIALRDGRPVPCCQVRCYDCEFCENDSFGGCNSARKAWLNAEHIEKPKLTKKERQFCELVETGWITRDKGVEDLMLHKDKPVKGSFQWNSNRHLYHSDKVLDIFGFNFSFITWDDKEPWSVEDLLKLEYEQ